LFADALAAAGCTLSRCRRLAACKVIFERFGENVLVADLTQDPICRGNFTSVKLVRVLVIIAFLAGEYLLTELALHWQYDLVMDIGCFADTHVVVKAFRYDILVTGITQGPISSCNFIPMKSVSMRDICIFNSAVERLTTELALN
jgi:hypothetical protein